MTVMVLRINEAYQYHKIKELSHIQIHQFQKKTTWLYLASGIVWTLSYILIFVYGDANSKILALTISIGIAGTSLLSSGERFSRFLALNLISAITLLVYFIFNAHKIGLILPIFATLAFVFIFLSAYRFSKNITENITSSFRLEKSRYHLLDVLSKAGEYRDTDTGDHIFRVSNCCYLLAKELGIPHEESIQIQHASRLHDLGKIAIPDNILLKEGKLTSEEMGVMKTHCQIGHDILGDADSSIVNLAKKIAITHHEKWDGSGYPNKIKGNEIPLEGRITAICDVFDALMSKRSYKRSWKHAEIIAFIREQSGKHFDPNLVPPFLKIVNQIIKEQNKTAINNSAVLD